MLDNFPPPASWDSLKDALNKLPPKAIQDAINVQLQSQPSAEVYDFLTRTLQLSVQNLSAYIKEESETSRRLGDTPLRELISEDHPEGAMSLKNRIRS